MEKLEELRSALSEVLKKSEVIVDDIYLKKQGKYTFLTVVLDKVGGIDLSGMQNAHFYL